jgi:hypothetical protein
MITTLRFDLTDLTAEELTALLGMMDKALLPNGAYIDAVEEINDELARRSE